MGQARRGEIHRQIQVLFHCGSVAGLSDGQLLERFTSRDGPDAERAFALLVQRHGATVLRVCRGVLRDAHDAEDAVQATFLVLARKAGSIRSRSSVGSWLYGVAFRVASEMRGAVARRRVVEGRAAALRPAAAAVDDDDWSSVVLSELERLPDRLRAAVVLCYLEGRTCEEAASRLGWPVGTVKTRLAQARKRLRARLSRRGCAPLLAPPSATRAVPSHPSIPITLEESVVRAAVRFASGKATAGLVASSVASSAEGVLNAMVWNAAKLNLVAAAVMAGVAVVGVSVAARPVPHAAAPATAPKGFGSTGSESLPRSLELAQADAGGEPLALGGRADSGLNALPTALPELEVRLAHAKRLLERYEALSQRGQASTSQVDEARFELDLIQVRLAASKQDLEDLLERLEGRLRVKQAELDAAKTRFHFMEQLGNAQRRGADEVAFAKSDLAVQEAELMEVAIQIKQVKRRMGGK